jgi:hypothetical protein
MSYRFQTRAQHKKTYTPNQESFYDLNGVTYIHSPTIDRVKLGMRIEVWESKHGNSNKTKGIIVVGFNKVTGEVLVRDNVGGTKEHDFWCHIDDVQQVWSIGNKTVHEVLDMLGAFNTAVLNAVEERKTLETLN